MSWSICSSTQLLPVLRCCRYFQELDFDWSLDVQQVLSVVPKVVQIIAEEVRHIFGLPELPHYVISMRTPYKVHLNFPDVLTTEGIAYKVRAATINRCRQDISGLPPLADLPQQLAQPLQRKQQPKQQALSSQPISSSSSSCSDSDPIHSQAAISRGTCADTQKDTDKDSTVSSSTTAAIQGSKQCSHGSSSPSCSNQVTAGGDSSFMTHASSSPADIVHDYVSTSATNSSNPLVAGMDSLDNSSTGNKRDADVSSTSAGGIADISGQPGSAGSKWQDLNWDSIIDCPHGSLRLLASNKPPWLDKDPGWVREKAYSRAEYVDGQWLYVPLTLETLMQCSIHPTPAQRMEYEQSHAFLNSIFEVSYCRC